MLPTLPTDNLYKFIALSGIFLFCFSIYFITGKIDALNERTYADKLLVGELEVKSAWLGDETDKLKKILVELKRLRESNEPCKLIIAISDKDLTSIAPKLSDLMLQLELNRMKIKLSMERSLNLANELKIYLIGLCVASLLSISLSFFGFILWYQRVQLPLDKAATTAFNSEVT